MSILEGAIKILLTKKAMIIVTAVIFAIIGIAVLQEKGGLSPSPSSSPAATVKAFYKALNDGDIDKAKKYVAFETSLKNLFGSEEKALMLKGKIKGVEIVDEQNEKAFGTEQAILLIKLALKSGVKEEAERKIEAERRRFPNSASVIYNNYFLANFSEDEKVYLQKYEEGWKIFEF